MLEERRSVPVSGFRHKLVQHMQMCEGTNEWIAAWIDLQIYLWAGGWMHEPTVCRLWKVARIRLGMAQLVLHRTRRAQDAEPSGQKGHAAHTSRTVGNTVCPWIYTCRAARGARARAARAGADGSSRSTAKTGEVTGRRVGCGLENGPNDPIPGQRARPRLFHRPANWRSSYCRGTMAADLLPSPQLTIGWPACPLAPSDFGPPQSSRTPRGFSGDLAPGDPGRILTDSHR